MSASPTSAAASTKRPLEDPSSPSGPTDQPDAKRPALDKVANSEDQNEHTAPTSIPGTDGVKVEETKAETTTAPVENGTNGTQPEAGASDSSAAQADTQPIPSTASQERASSQQPSAMSPQDESKWIHIRAVISSAEAATIIGKGGENVSQIRRLSGAKCTVSDYTRGAVERILTVSGQQDATAKVCSNPLLPISFIFVSTNSFLRHSASSSVPSTTNLLTKPPLRNPRPILSAFLSHISSSAQSLESRAFVFERFRKPLVLVSMLLTLASHFQLNVPWLSLASLMLFTLPHTTLLSL